ncbi:MAG: molybdopterin-dependent oxidoreductase [Gammaproteobacteria bacterium]|nr:molybdopterin-dependent oxidoreductase [Gammaproteobacteria bacterium]
MNRPGSIQPPDDLGDARAATDMAWAVQRADRQALGGSGGSARAPAIGALSRRRFLVGAAAAGAGLSLGVLNPRTAAASASATADEVNAWVVIKPDDSVVIRIARSEMGQGTLTGLAQMVAEELDCDWSKVDWEYPSPRQNLLRDRVWRSFATGGSRGIRGSHQYVREGGAAARLMLVEAAAGRWQVSAAECSAANSIITHKPSGRTLTYGAVANDAAKLAPPLEVKLKDPKDWKLIGQPVKRLDTADKLNGKQVFGADIQLPGMLNAAVSACPVFGGARKRFDAAKVAAMPGVKGVVPLDNNAVAVVADTWWRAQKALKALPIEWDFGDGGSLSQADIIARLDEGLTAETPLIGNQSGDARAALESAETLVEATYSYPYLNHATMEPMNATARWTEDFCEVWCPTQNGEAAHAGAAEAAGLPLEQVEVHKVHLGGGFGRRGAPDYVRQAVLIAKQFPGTPVKLLWSREEDMMQGFFHPITKARVRGGLDADGKLEALHLRVSGQSILAGLMPNRLADGVDFATFQGLLPEGDQRISYRVENLLVDHAMRNTHIRPGFWRGVNVNQNAVYMECFLDELAHAAGTDALAFREPLMRSNPRGWAVLQAVAERSGWASRQEDGRHLGLAVFHAFGSDVAACAEVTVEADDALRIKRIVAATDPGFCVNPQQTEAQVEGSFVYGLSALLYGECTVRDGQIEQRNFDTFPSLQISQMPEVETLVMPSGGFWGGVGEPTIAVAAPAVLNAIFAATGKRCREVPLKRSGLKFA